MKIIKWLVFGLFILLCHACASTPEPVQYYSLTLGAAQNEPVQKGLVRNESAPAGFAGNVIIEPVYLAKFLRQDGIVTQVGDNEVAIASYHRWAEPLDKSIARLLTGDLNSRISDYHFSWMQLDVDKPAAFKLRLAFNEFNIKNNSSVNVAGHYWLYVQSSGLKKEGSFNITKPLTDDGYAHAVTQLQQAIAQLADEIIVALQKPLTVKKSKHSRVNSFD